MVFCKYRSFGRSFGKDLTRWKYFSLLLFLFLNSVNVSEEYNGRRVVSSLYIPDQIKKQGEEEYLVGLPTNR